MNGLGIDIGGTSVKLTATRSDGSVLWTGRSAFYSRPCTEELLSAIRAAAEGRDVRAGVAGLCVPGLLDRSKRTITLAVNVPGLVDVPLDDLVAAAFGVDTIGRIEILNDAVAAGFDFVRSHGLRGRTLVLALGTGVGAAVLDDGLPLLVEGDSPGHVGQLDVTIDESPVIGPDGGAGSLEGYFGTAAIRRFYGDDLADSFARMRVTDPPIRALVRAIRICHAIYRPNQVVLLGGIGVRMKSLAAELQAAIAERLTSVARNDWQMLMGDDDFHAARGAAMIALSR